MAAKGKRAQVEAPAANDPLMVLSVEKALRVLSAFDEHHPTMSLTQLAEAVDLDKSAAQRFAHTLTRLGYLQKDPETKRLSLTVKNLSFAYQYTRANRLVSRTMPYLVHLSNATDETVNLTILHETDIVIVARVMSRDVLHPDMAIGRRLPAYCTASGVAILSKLPRAEALEVLKRSDLKRYTEHTVCDMKALVTKLDLSARRGYAVVNSEYFANDLSVAAPIVNASGHSIGAINISTSRPGFVAEEVEAKFAPLVIAAARSISESSR